MKKKAILFICIIFSVILAGVFYFEREAETANIFTIKNEEIITYLKKNDDAREYIEKNADFLIKSKEVLTKNSIIAGRSGQNFKEVYQDLELEDERYLKIDLMNKPGDRGFIAVLDYKTKEVKKAYGVILLQMKNE